MKVSEQLLKDRGGETGNYSCPLYLSTTACKKLFDEAGVVPEPKCVGMLGDVLENFALLLLEGWEGCYIDKSKFAQTVADIMD